MPIKVLLMRCIRGYQRFISPLFLPRCRFYPTCSTYALRALEKHGAIKGTLMTISRLLRCQPCCRGGVDHVPDQFTLRRNHKRKSLVDYQRELNEPSEAKNRKDDAK